MGRDARGVDRTEFPHNVHRRSGRASRQLIRLWCVEFSVEVEHAQLRRSSPSMDVHCSWIAQYCYLRSLSQSAVGIRLIQSATHRAGTSVRRSRTRLVCLPATVQQPGTSVPGRRNRTFLRPPHPTMRSVRCRPLTERAETHAQPRAPPRPCARIVLVCEYMSV